MSTYGLFVDELVEIQGLVGRGLGGTHVNWGRTVVLSPSLLNNSPKILKARYPTADIPITIAAFARNAATSGGPKMIAAAIKPVTATAANPSPNPDNSLRNSPIWLIILPILSIRLPLSEPFEGLFLSWESGFFVFCFLRRGVVILVTAVVSIFGVVNVSVCADVSMLLVVSAELSVLPVLVIVDVVEEFVLVVVFVFPLVVLVVVEFSFISRSQSTRSGSDIKLLSSSSIKRVSGNATSDSGYLFWKHNTLFWTVSGNN